MSINRLRQLGAQTKVQRNPIEDDWGEGWNDSEDLAQDEGGKDLEFEAGGFDNEDDFSDDDDDFGTKKPAINNMDDDTPDDNDEAIGDDDEDDSDLDGLGFDLQQAVSAGKRAAFAEETLAEKKRKDQEAERLRIAEEEEIRRKIEDKAREEREARARREKEELEAVKNSLRERVEISISRNKGSTIEKGSKEESKALSDDLQGFLGQLENHRGRPKDSFQLDGSLIPNNQPDDNKTFEEFDIEEKFKDLSSEDQ